MASSVDEDGEDRWCELDSHADTCVAGSNCIPLGPAGPRVNVHAFAPGYGAKTYHIRTAATVWMDESNGNKYLLVFHQCIFLGKDMKHTLVNPNHLRNCGLVVHDCPKQFNRKSKHSITVPTHDLNIPLKLRGVISGFQTRLPTSTDVESLPHVKMTRDVWDPRSDNFAAAEAHAKAVSSVRVTDHDDAEARFISATHVSEIPPDMMDADDGDNDNLYNGLLRLFVSRVLLRTRRTTLTPRWIARMHSTNRLMLSSLASVNPS